MKSVTKQIRKYKDDFDLCSKFRYI